MSEMARWGRDTVCRLRIAEEVARLAEDLERLAEAKVRNMDGVAGSLGVEDARRLAAAIASARCSHHGCMVRVHDLLEIMVWARRSIASDDPTGSACWLLARSQSGFFARQTLRDAEDLGLLRAGDALALLEAYRIGIRPDEMSWEDWVSGLGQAVVLLRDVVERVETAGGAPSPG